MRILVLLLVILSLATFWDYKQGRIPNIIIAVGIGLGIVNLLLDENLSAIIKHLPGIVGPIVLFYPVYKVGGIGAGDLKLLSMLGFYFSFMEMMFCIFISIFLAALLSLIKMTYHQNFLERIKYFFSYFQEVITTGNLKYYYEEETEEIIKRTKIHLACPILLAVLVMGGI